MRPIVLLTAVHAQDLTPLEPYRSNAPPLQPPVSSAKLLRPVFAGADVVNEDVKDAAQQLREELNSLEALFDRHEFLASARMTAADCVCFPEVRLVLRASERYPETMRRLEFYPLADAYPRLTAWAARVEAMPGYAKTFPAHWRVA